MSHADTPAAALRSRFLRMRLTLVLLVIAAVALWTHVYRLRSMPMGFYADETSISYNAYLIAETGHDEYGVKLPLYTRSFNDYKNPVYIYLSALLIKLFGYGFWMVRLPSVLCWIAGTCLLYAVARRLWPAPALRPYVLLALAFTPSFFCLSRIAFEVIALYPVLALFLFAVLRAFEPEQAEERTLLWAAAAGLAIGLSTYVYTTFRLLAPLHCLLLLGCYAHRRYLARLAVLGAVALVTVIPFGLYLGANPEHITSRYQRVGYIHKPLPLLEKLQIFVQNYRTYFGADYLIRAGDPNLRHHTGFGGELLWPTLLGAALGLVALAAPKRVRASRFHWLLLGGLVLSPVAAALTNDARHSLRVFSLPIFAVLLSVAGYELARQYLPRAAPWIVSVATAAHAGLFVYDYFGSYTVKSIRAFEYYGQRQAIERAVQLGAARIFLDSSRGSRHADMHAKFYTTQLSKRWGARLPPLLPGRARDLTPGDFLIFEDLHHGYPELRAGMPEHTIYLPAPYGTKIRPRRKRR